MTEPDTAARCTSTAVVNGQLVIVCKLDMGHVGAMHDGELIGLDADGNVGAQRLQWASIPQPRGEVAYALSKLVEFHMHGAEHMRVAEQAARLVQFAKLRLILRADRDLHKEALEHTRNALKMIDPGQ